LFHNKKKSRSGGSPLGLHLAAALKEFGLVVASRIFRTFECGGQFTMRLQLLL
jgi:hypothetical protein